MTGASALLHESAYYRVELLRTANIVKVIRLARPFVSQDDVNFACEPVQLALDSTRRRTTGLLIDTRLAIGKNDPDYERWFEDHRKRMLEGFPRIAFLVQSVIGKLHVERLIADLKMEKVPRVFLDEALALRHLAAA